MQQAFCGKRGGKPRTVPLPASLVQKLIETLSQEISIMQALLAEAERQQAALLDDDLVILEEVIAKEMGLLQELEQWESQRLCQVADIEEQMKSAERLPESQTGVSLEQIATRAPSPMGQLLLNQGEELKEIMLRLQELNLLNANLLHQSLTLTNYCLSLITGDTGQMIYGEPGKKERQGYQPGRLDARA